MFQELLFTQNLQVVRDPKKIPTRPESKGPIFPATARGNRYSINLEAKQPVRSDSAKRDADLELEWNGDRTGLYTPFSAEYLEPFSDSNCVDHSTCLACLTNALCGWCPLSRTCFVRTDRSVLCSAHSENKTHLLVTDPKDCSICQDYINCGDCTSDSSCEWLPDEAYCLRRGRFPSATVTSPSNCSLPCHERNSCADCVEMEKNECVWCDSLGACFPFHMYTARFAYGQCQSWKDSQTWSYSESGHVPVSVKENADENHCRACELVTTCKECLAFFTCGWCGNDNNPNNGVCVRGDFAGPKSGRSCVDIVGEKYDILKEKKASWSYAECPDVEECRLGLDDCHPNATCSNTRHGFNCTCDRGFAGDGKEKCDKTCYYDCLHGNCSNAPLFECVCDVGWTGDSCELDCGCHNHSTCNRSIGTCDLCLHHTTGDHCELCMPGSYGDATDPHMGCRRCNCNGHQIEAENFCDQRTGHCFCKDNTKGPHCNECKEGFYGDPRDGGLCYHECAGRVRLTNISTGALGSGRDAAAAAVAVSVDEDFPVAEPAYCLWILTVYDSITDAPAEAANATIAFTITDINTICDKDFVYVYDGIPNFMQHQYNKDRSIDYKLLGAFCGSNQVSSLTVSGTSGYLTIYFEANVGYTPRTGFNATFQVHRCPHLCTDNWNCDSDMKKCVCRKGYTGINCDIPACPGDCSSNGVCDEDSGFCLCHPGFVGRGCNISLSSSSIAIELMPPFPLPIFHPTPPPLELPSLRRSFPSPTAGDLSRMGHILVSCKPEYLWMYGGYNLNFGILNDTVRYDLVSRSWTPIVSSRPVAPDSPASVGRYFHAGVCVPRENSIYLYGGMALAGKRSTTGPEVIDEFWRLNLDLQVWQRMESTPPPLAGHTLTLVGTHVVLIGGFSPYNTFSTGVYVYDLDHASWSVQVVEGSKPTGLYGHTAVYHAKSKSIYVFGGYEYQMDTTVITNRLYALTYPGGHWNLLPPEPSVKVSPRFFHAAVGFPDQMIVIGGRSPDRDFDPEVLSYSYQCNEWRKLGPDSQYVASPVVQMWNQFKGTIAHRAAVVGDAIYVMGGFDGESRGELFRLHIPVDICAIYSGNEKDCVFSLGCSACSLASDENNMTICYSNHLPMPEDCNLRAQGVTCDLQRLNSTAVSADGCGRHRGCPHCLALFPVHGNKKPLCQWCSNCPEGRCMLAGKNCSNENYCRREQRVISHNNDCVEELCQAPDCVTCKSLKLSVRRNDNLSSCIWTQQFKRSSEVSRKLALTPIYDWNCVTRNLLEATPIGIASSPPQPCPQYCYEHTTCRSCVESHGGEGGHQSCRWSELMQECLTPSFLPLHCANGECGRIIWGSPSSDPCPQPCAKNTQCSTCLAQPGCGWCALEGLNGMGACMEGGVRGPATGVCLPGRNVTYGDEESDARAIPDLETFATLQAASSGGSWNYGDCPPENECENDHHDCDRENQECRDRHSGFECVCREGYEKKLASTTCVPVCENGCDHGDCIFPNECRCHFSFVGNSCSTECKCNGHSNCLNENNVSRCLKCYNDTTGSQCQFCKRNFVGDPISRVRCKPCREYCNQHSDVCIASNAVLTHGPRELDNPVCVNCTGNTEGDKCQYCIDGYFRHARSGPQAECNKCHCNGHSDQCNKLNGEDCNCGNNTVTNCPSIGSGASSDESECWEKQCSQCRESFQGQPTEGHQCYRQMSVDHSICLDPSNGFPGDCSKSLPPGKALFYFVQPKYLNVDIRLTIDVSQGAVDVFFSPFKKTFKVGLDSSWHHVVELDRNLYAYDGFDNHHDNEAVTTPQPLTNWAQSLQSRRRRFVESDVGAEREFSDGKNVDSLRKILPTISSSRPEYPRRRSHASVAEDVSVDSPETTETNAAPGTAGDSGHHNSDSPKKRVAVVQRVAGENLNTFVTLRDNQSVLLVKDVRYRLVVSLPLDVFDLRTSRFYVAIVSKSGTGDHSNGSIGNLFFRQDQPHIDLFVFFSVFFSCFFLFLAVCVVIWKMKQQVDMRRARQRAAIEMAHMRSRPFSRVSVLCSPIPAAVNGDKTPVISASDLASFPANRTSSAQTAPKSPPSSTTSPTKYGTLGSSGIGGVNVVDKEQVPLGGVVPSVRSAPPLDSDAGPGVSPIALEPTDDGIAAVATVVVELPRGVVEGAESDSAPPDRICLGSSLVMMRVHYPTLLSHHNQGGRSVLVHRRRPSHSGVAV